MFSLLDTPTYWDELYINKTTGWDLKKPNPVWEELVNKKEFIQPCKLLVTGCGYGHDAILAAKKGYDVTAIDFSKYAISCARESAESSSAKVNFVADNLFTLGEAYFEKFDVVYEYTTYCAINPDRRKEYLSKICSFIKPGGKLIAILFPIDGREGGPPFNIDVNKFYEQAINHVKLEFFSKQINSVKPRKGKEILQVYKKPIR
jgi:methyl halide transferase